MHVSAHSFKSFTWCQLALSSSIYFVLYSSNLSPWIPCHTWGPNVNPLVVQSLLSIVHVILCVFGCNKNPWARQGILLGFLRNSLIWAQGSSGFVGSHIHSSIHSFRISLFTLLQSSIEHFKSVFSFFQVCSFTSTKPGTVINLHFILGSEDIPSSAKNVNALHGIVVPPDVGVVVLSIQSFLHWSIVDAFVHDTVSDNLNPAGIFSWFGKSASPYAIKSLGLSPTICQIDFLTVKSWFLDLTPVEGQFGSFETSHGSSKYSFFIILSLTAFALTWVFNNAPSCKSSTQTRKRWSLSKFLSVKLVVVGEFFDILPSTVVQDCPFLFCKTSTLNSTFSLSVGSNVPSPPSYLSGNS